MKHFLPLFTVAISVAQPAQGADPLCTVIKRLETANPEKGVSPHERRWIEFHWGYDRSPHSIWSWGCRHSDDDVARQTCSWLQNNTNQEFTMMLPQSIMTCYGYSFPPHAAYDWGGMAATITLHGRDDRRLLLDLNYRDLPHGENAMRLAVELDDVQYAPEELPPIAPMPTAAALDRRNGS